MIKSKDELKYYIDCDMKAKGFTHGIKDITFVKRIEAILVPQPWRFQELLRKAEYHVNVGSNLSKKIIGKFWKIRVEMYGNRCGYSIPLNVFGPGLYLSHTGTVVINSRAKFGSNARIHVGVNIGAFSRFDEKWSKNNVPVIGDNVYIGPGAKVFGSVQIGDNVAIGANAVVSKDVPSHCTVVGANKIVNEKGSIDMMQYGDLSVIPPESYAYRKLKKIN